MYKEHTILSCKCIYLSLSTSCISNLSIPHLHIHIICLLEIKTRSSLEFHVWNVEQEKSRIVKDISLLLRQRSECLQHGGETQPNGHVTKLFRPRVLSVSWMKPPFPSFPAGERRGKSGYIVVFEDSRHDRQKDWTINHFNYHFLGLILIIRA